ncbi:MAG: putative metal-binding motif-containing protein [Myxococcales bacterium]|nr:putative metal-binding motif-containing protein [Myxococcales bacterium]
MRIGMLFCALLALPTTSLAAARDTDGDGVPDHKDCDPYNATIYPGAKEACDGVDNDCDGTVDEGCKNKKGGSLYDRDGDGWDFDDGDCDDSDPAVNPGAKEVCDKIDNDCDGTIDEGCATDKDGDGHSSNADCDDSDPRTYPGAKEACDGIDNDCDLDIDEGCADSGDTADTSDTGLREDNKVGGCSAAGAGASYTWMLPLPLLLLIRRRWS